MTEKTPRKHEHLRKWQPGESGNPKGRPPGSGLAGSLRRAIAAQAADVIAALIAKAKEGDVQAARALLDRLVPPLRAQSAPVAIPGFDTATGLAERAQAALRAAGRGEVPPDVAAGLVAAVGALAKIIETEELERRIRALEART